MNKSPFSYLVQVKVHSMSRISRCRSRIRKMSRVVYISTSTYNNHKSSLKIVESIKTPKLQTFFVPTLNNKKILGVAFYEVQG